MRKFRILVLLALVAACGQPPVRFEMADKTQFKSQYLNFTPKVIVYLPRDYRSSDARYPVLYAHDGQNLFTNATSFAGEWQLDENIEALQAAGLLDGIIVVGIYNTAMRMWDYTPTLISNEFVANQGGNLSNYAKFIVEELKPYIDATYRTLPGRENTGVMGSSLGGLASFYILGMYPDVFSKAAAISPSFWWDNVRVTNDMQSLTFPPDVKIYIDGGWMEGADESSMVAWMRAVYKRLLARGLKDIDNLYYYEDPAGQHNEQNWARRGKMPLLYLFGHFQPVVEKARLVVQPPLIGVGDTSKCFAIIKYTNNMLFTRFTGTFKVDNANATINNLGEIRGVRAGNVVVSYDMNGTILTQSVTIIDHSREWTRLTFSVTAPAPVTGLSINIVRESGRTTNILVPLRQVSPTNAAASVMRKSGTSIIYTIVNTAGGQGYNPSGTLIRPTVQFGTDKTNKITVGEFR